MNHNPDFYTNFDMAITPAPPIGVGHNGREVSSNCTNALILIATKIVETEDAIAAYGEGFTLVISTN